MPSGMPSYAKYLNPLPFIASRLSMLPLMEQIWYPYSNLKMDLVKTVIFTVCFHHESINLELFDVNIEFSCVVIKMSLLHFQEGMRTSFNITKQEHYHEDSILCQKLSAAF